MLKILKLDTPWMKLQIKGLLFQNSSLIESCITSKKAKKAGPKSLQEENESDKKDILSNRPFLLVFKMT